MASASPLLLIFAGLLGTWFGAAIFYVVIVGPAANQAGSSAVGFLQTLARRHGTGPFYAVLAFLTVIAGVWLYLAESASATNVWISLGVILAILALVLGASANRIAERKWVNAVNNVRGSAEQGAEVVAALAKAARTNVITTIVIGLALVCVILSRIVT